MTATVQTFSGGSWLAVNGGGNTPATSSVTVNPAGLADGVYKGQVAFSAPGTGNSPIVVPVTLTITSAPALTTAPSALTFASQLNGRPPANQTILLNSSDGSAQPIGSVVASNGATWLGVSQNAATTPATLTVSINPAGLTPGVYQGSILISSPSSQSSPIIVPVIFTLSAQPSLTASSTAATFAAGVGGVAPQSLQVNIGSTGAPLTFTSSVAPGAAWLSVTGSGTTTAPIQIRVNPAGLPAGRYRGTVVIAAPGAANNPLLLPVDLIVSGAPLLITSSSSLQFSTGPSGSAPPQTLIVNSTGAALPVTVSTSPATPWLSVSGAGTTPLNLTVGVNTAGLVPGSYQGSIQIVAPGAGNSPLLIPVALQITSAPVLQANPSPIAFTHQAHTTPPSPQTVNVTLSGQPATALGLGVGPGASWLSAVEGAAGRVNIVANPTGVLPGLYSGIVTITAADAANSPLTVPVSLTVTGFPEFNVSQEALAFAAARPQSEPISTTITLGTGSNPPVNFALDVTASTWLSITPLTGSTPATLTVTVDPANLRPGSYSGSVIISSNGNRVRTISVNLVVDDTPPLSSSPPFLQFSYLQGGDLPSPVNIWVGRFGANFPVTATPSESWISVDPSSSTSGPLKVTVSPTGLSTGTHSGFILLTGSSGTAGTPPPVRRVPVTLYVNQPADPRIAGVRNGMSFVDTPLAPGLIFSIFGTGLGPESPSGPTFQADGTLSQSVAGVEVLVNGIPCPLLYVSSTQINAIAPYALFNRTSADVAVRFRGILSDEVPVSITQALPGVFSAPQNGAGPGVILNQDLSVNTPTNPAGRNTIMAIYAGGGGQSSPQGLDGSINGSLPLPGLLLPVSVVVGGIRLPTFPTQALRLDSRMALSRSTSGFPMQFPRATFR